MKNIVKIALLMSVALVLLAACDSKLTMLDTRGNDIAKEGGAGQYYNIWVGQNIGGTVWVHNDPNYLYLEYTLYEPWLITESKVHVAANYAGIPKNKQGVPIPGMFTYHQPVDPPSATYIHAIPMTWGCGQPMVIAAHLDISQFVDDTLVPTETGWGGDTPGGSNRWWYYIEYVWECYGTGTETAWARMYDYEDPLFEYQPGHGGGNWATFVMLDSDAFPQTFPIYAGQYIDVGTADVWVEDGDIKIDINLDDPYFVDEHHVQLYANPPSGNPAPGLFLVKGGAIDDDYVISYPWNGRDNYMGLHLVVGGFPISPDK
ncbi:MAG: hypothetical protein K0B87_04280 [Candidatus Syntrophosphaera sp.]|nr:hypothetical protein [Candidatus Syntrophosphaera sp.]